MQKNQPGSFSQNAATQQTDKPSFSIEIPQISLPKGGGAIKGIDEKFEVNTANGTASFSLPLPFSPARNGFMPSLTLGYNSGGGNGLFGLGWDLGFPSIQRKTDKGLPRYQDDEESDIFVFSGAEDLVPALTPLDAIDDFVRDGYRIRRYRPRVEGGFARIERITHNSRGVWWKVTTRDNVTTFFGKNPEFRIADPNDVLRIFQWLPELSFDDKGNCVLYNFKPEDGSGYGDAVFDTNRFDSAGRPRFVNRYLKRVLYCPARPFLPSLDTAEGQYETNNPATDGFLMELLFDYGEHGDVPRENQGDIRTTHLENRPWATRHDAFSSYRSGFEIRTARLCQRVLMFHYFAELGDTPCLVRSLDLRYRDWDLLSEPDEGKKLEVTYLVSATQRSYIRYEDRSDDYRHRGLPPFEFEYQELAWNKEVQSISSENLAHAPVGLGSGYQWVDLYNEGISGILTEQGEAWWYKENLGNGQFTPARPVFPKPSLMGISSGVLQLQDLEADGRKQVVVNSPGLNGYFELTAENGWESFRAFEQITNVDLRDPYTRLLDLNGDGQPEIVITEESVFTWYASAGTRGYGSPETAPKPFDEEQGPAIVFADQLQTIFLADMSGDGLTDIVRIRNGEVCYWPNLGYGRFGRKITMAGSPYFDLPDQFNPSYLQLADVSGTGATDLIYLGKNQFRAWLNLSGNAWSAPCDIEPFFDTAQPNQISVTDLLGNGTACIVWSSPLPGDSGEPMRYIDLMGGKKPHILISYKNNLGKETRWTYQSSTHFYLEDKKAGTPWITKLPFPVQVVRSVTVEDQWRNTRFSNQYSYHHGYYDHAEREFRGFGRVEQTDIEDFGTFTAGNSNSPYITGDQMLYQPPIKTITWYHTGAFLSRDRILNQFEQEYFRPNGGDFYENELPEPDLEAEGLSADEYREALRACKGMALRTETYELQVADERRTDDENHVTEERVRLYSAAFHNCHIQRLQAKGPNPHAVFLVTESEAITYHYELDLQQSELQPDPRIAHTLNLDIDDLGNVLESISIAYPRWQNASFDDPLLPEGAERLIQDVQSELHIVYTENHFTGDVITPRDHRLRMPCEVKTYELSGVGLARHSYFALADFSPNQLQALAPTAYHLQPAGGLRKRLVEHVRMLYFNDRLTAPEPLGQLNRLGLPYETYKIALSEELLEAVLGDKLLTLQNLDESRTAMLDRVLPLGGYYKMDDTWWIRSGIAGFEENAATHFYLPERYTDPFGNTTVLAYDPRDLFIQRSRDPLGNEVEVLAFDYRLLAPSRMRDPNNNISEVLFDILGIPAAMALRGKGEEGDSLEGMLPDLDETAIQAFFTGAYDEAQARAWLGNATARHMYYLGDADHPACAAGLMRERHGSVNSPFQIALEYSDGSGQVIATKVQAEPAPGSADMRWITNGKTILNNKGKPVKQYEPYFTDHQRYAEPDTVGVTPIIYYDAAGRTVRTEMPDGTYSRVEFSPWHMAAWDASDTVQEDGNAWLARYSGGSPEEQRAARLAAVHANTPAVTHLDSLGREVAAIAHNKWQRDGGVSEEKYLTYTKLDAEGKPLWIQDARGNRVMEYINRPGADAGFSSCYDIAGNLLFQHSMDGGDRWMLPDSTGQPLYVWDANEYAGVMEQRLKRSEYDALRRPTRQWLRINDEAEREISRILYGEGLPIPQANNLRGQAVISLGPEGRTEAVAFDFKGNLLESRRQLLADATVHTMDWSDYVEERPSGHLSPEVFVQSTEYDALNRMVRLENWHLDIAGRSPAVYTPTYNRRGVLESETLSVQGEVTPAIQLIEYNAKGQRTLLRLGNGTNTHYTYDPLSFRLTRLHTSPPLGGPDLLQDLHYTYDPSGNIAQIEDRAQDTVFFRNRQVKPVQAYEYDALYRLIRADGRENATNSAPGPGPHPFGPLDTTIPGDGALRNYTQHYHYDPVGNFVEMRHSADGGSWTRRYTTASDSNRLLRTWLGDDEPGAVLYRYDTHGSMLNFANVPEEQNNRWDYCDMIHTLDLGGGGRAFYQYDTQKQRTRKRIVRNGNEYWERLYLGGYELYRRYVGGVLTEEAETHHLFADDQRVLIAEDVRLASPQQQAGVLYRYQYSNHLGSVGLECEDSGQIISYEEYHPYGTTAYQARNAEIRAASKRYRYTGMERDEESGLAYHTARYYVVWLGRWGSCDPIGIRAGLNLFRYVSNNFLVKRDPTGLDEVTIYHRTTEGAAASMARTGASTSRSRAHVWAGGGFYGSSTPSIPSTSGASGDTIVAQRISTDRVADLDSARFRRGIGANLTNAFEDSARGRSIRSLIYSQMYDQGETAARTLGRRVSDADIDLWFRNYINQQIDRIAPNSDVIQWRNSDGSLTYVVRRESALIGTPTVVGHIRNGRFQSVDTPRTPQTGASPRTQAEQRVRVEAEPEPEASAPRVRVATDDVVEEVAESTARRLGRRVLRGAIHSVPLIGAFFAGADIAEAQDRGEHGRAALMAAGVFIDPVDWLLLMWDVSGLIAHLILSGFAAEFVADRRRYAERLRSLPPDHPERLLLSGVR
ncbi:MAG: SpvB/TcaC N-terminal domain-containing protein [Bacteroidia bacterium]|nr:SpvB/TcaC N-terminal domain-containing protein [Bacteroidia bacterium]